MAPRARWIDFGKRLYRAVVALELSYGEGAKQIGVAKASFYRACNGEMPNGDNYVKMLSWLKDSQRRIGRKRTAAAARRAIRRTKDVKAQLSTAKNGHRPSRARKGARYT